MEAIQTGLRGVLRLILFLVLITGYAVHAGFFALILRDPKKRRHAFQKNTRFFSGLMLKSLGLKLIVTNRPTDSHQGSLIVSNHMGFIDILILASVMPVSFITSHEMKENTLLGPITELAGCMYVERRSRTRILEEMKSLAMALKEGFDVVLYPEATSTNGERVLPFKRTLMMAAAEAGVPIRPAVVNFREVNGEDFHVKWRDSVCWYGDVSFGTSFWGTLTLKSVTAEIEFLDVITVNPGDDRGLIADKAHALISSKFVPVKGAMPEAETPGQLETDPT
ncbi:MAG: lysophospholipid acyltransferase family protein [Bdellovibrio sp.]